MRVCVYSSQRVTLRIHALSRRRKNWKCIKLAHSDGIFRQETSVTSWEVSTSVTSAYPLIEWDVSVPASIFFFAPDVFFFLHNYINMVIIYTTLCKRIQGCHGEETGRANHCQTQSADL